MVDIHELIIRHKKYTYYLLALFVLGWGFTPYQRVFLGLVIGICVCFVSLSLVAKRTDKLMERVLKTKETKIRYKATAVSTYSRLAATGLVILFAVQYPHYIEVWGFALGLMTGYLVMIIDYIYLQYIKGREER